MHAKAEHSLIKISNLSYCFGLREAIVLTVILQLFSTLMSVYEHWASSTTCLLWRPQEDFWLSYNYGNVIMERALSA